MPPVITARPAQVEPALKTEVSGAQAVGTLPFLLSGRWFERACDQCSRWFSCSKALAVNDNQGSNAARLRGKMEKMKEKVAEKDPDSNRSAFRRVKHEHCCQA